MKTKKIAVLIILALIVGIIACTKKPDPNNENNNSTDTTTKPTDTTTKPTDTTTTPTDTTTTPTDTTSDMGKKVKIIFLHHSTGGIIWNGGVKNWFDNYNTSNGTEYNIKNLKFPGSGYPWNNYPYDYWNIWIKNAGPTAYSGQKTLEILTKEYDVIIWKHCYPVSDILPDDTHSSATSEKKTVGNYKKQYNELKTKMKSYPNTRFIVWTGAVKLKAQLPEDRALRTKDFFDWVRNTWDEPNDNIYVWDFYQLETEGGLYLKVDNAQAATNSHPKPAFATKVAPFFCNRIVNVIKGKGDNTKITGE